MADSQDNTEITPPIEETVQTETTETVTTEEIAEPPDGDNGEPLRLDRIKRFVTSPTTIRVLAHMFLALGLIVIIVGSSFFFAKRAEGLGQEWVANLRPGRRLPGDMSPEPIERPLPPFSIQATEEEKGRLQDQRNDIRKKAKHHVDVAMFYYSRFYMAILAFSISAALAAISLAIISKRGLDSVNEYIVTMFLVMTAVALFYQSFPGVFQQKKNIEDNRALYIKYVNLEDDMLSFCVTGGVAVARPADSTTASENAASTPRPADSATPSQTKENAAGATPDVTVGQQYTIIKLSPREFIHYIDYQLKTYNDIAIGFDESKAASFAKEQFQTP